MQPPHHPRTARAPRLSSLSFKMIASALGLLAMVFVAVISAINTVTSSHLAEVNGHRAALLAHNVAQRIDNALYERFRTIARFADNGVLLSDQMGASELRTRIDKLRSHYPEYAWAGISDMRGQILASTGGVLEGQSAAKRPWFIEGQTAPVIHDVHEAMLLAPHLPAEAGNRLPRLIDIAVPLHRSDQSVWGVLGAHINIHWFGNIITQVLDDASRAERLTVAVQLLGRNGEVLVSEGINHSLDWSVQSRQDFLAGREGYTEAYQDGERVLVGYATLNGTNAYPRLGWRIAVIEPLDDVRAAQRRLATSGAAIGFGLLLAGGLIMVVLMRRMMAPLKQLTADAQHIAQAQESNQAPSADFPERHEDTWEVAQLRASLRQLVSSLRQQHDKTERLYQELSTRFDTIAENGPGMIFQLRKLPSGQPCFTYVSPHSQTLYGVAREDLLNDVRAIFSTVHVEDKPKLRAVHARAFSLGESFSTEYRAVRPDGQMVWVLLEAHHRRQDGQSIWDGIVLDITPRKEAEAALEKSRHDAEQASAAKSRFVATVSHEIRTPLNGILGFSEILSRQPLPEESLRQSQLIHESALNMLSLVNDMLDMSKMEAGHLRMDNTAFRVRKTVESCRSVMAVVAQKKGVALNVSVAPEVPEAITGDPARLRQVILNLLANALKFTDRGQVSLGLNTQGDTEHQRLVVSVQDSGIGMAPTQLEQLFQPFHQADPSVARHYGGTGLGLYISKRLVEAMGGCIGVQSTLGQGSEFRFEIPLLPATLIDSTPSPEPPTPTRPLRILVAEDIGTNQALVKALLEPEGHHLSFANDGKAAVALAGAHTYDLILMDINMPRMDGLEATRRIKALPAPHHSVRIVAMTANALVEDLQTTREAGMQGHLSKPIMRRELLALLHDVADHSPAPLDTEPTPMPTPPAPAFFDPRVLRELDDAVGADTRAALVQQWLDDAQAQQQALHGLRETPQPQALQTLCHRLAGNAGSFGLLGLTTLARHIEHRLRTGADPATLQSDLDRLIQHMRDATHVLDVWRHEPGPAELSGAASAGSHPGPG